MRLIHLPFLSILNSHLSDYPTPKNINYMWSFGSLSGLYISLQILSGILLVMFYVPHSLYAFNSVEHIMRDVNNGWLIRYLHANIASFFFVFVYIHMLRGLYFQSYYAPRKNLWFSGLIIFILMMATAFMGYVLPWGQMSFWGATVITNLFTAVPVVGPSLAQWLWGGFAIDTATLARFFSLHYLLPFIISIIVLIHLYFLHIKGSTNPLGMTVNTDKINFLPYFYIKDLFVISVSLVLLIWVSFFYPNMLGHPDNYILANPIITPSHIVPEWYFLYFYAILRSIPNKLGGVSCMAGAILILFLLSWVAGLGFKIKETTAPRLKIYFRVFFWFFVTNTIILGWIGAQTIEYPFTEIGIFTTIFYFGFLLFGTIILTTIETKHMYFSLKQTL
jgi:quinol-cytochrome oxidoreductase complex cytochrome b subunit